MLNGRLYRLAFAPLLVALAITAFSLGARPHGYSSTLAPDAFEGARAFSELPALARAYPDRRPGSAGDEGLAAHVVRVLKGLGGPAHGGFAVRTDSYEADTLEGSRQLLNVIAERPGSTNESAIVLVAQRDAAASGSRAELSATAALLELARVFAARATKRTIIIASTDAGSSGGAGVARLADSLHVPIDAAIVVGDLAGVRLHKPLVVPYSDSYGSAPLALQRTVSDAVDAQALVHGGSPSVFGQFAHLALPFSTGEQAPLVAAGVPAVLVSASGERGPAPADRVSGERLEGLGRGVLSAIDALDGAPDVTAARQTSVLLSRKTLPAWSVRLLALMLLLGPAIVAVDGLARLRRRRRPVARWSAWTLSCAIPFLIVALLARALGLSGAIPAPPAPVAAAALHPDGTAYKAIGALALTFALAWLVWREIARRLRAHVRAHVDADVAGVPMLLVLLAVAFVSWLGNPLTALLFVPALHLWLLLASPELRPRRTLGLALVLVGIAPALLVAAFYAHVLGLGAGATLWAGTLLLSGAHIGLGTALLWSLALGAAVVAGMLALTAHAPRLASGDGEEIEISIRGPLSYAGPGSLGGTESALYR
jgi:hypothetical protein